MDASKAEEDNNKTNATKDDIGQESSEEEDSEDESEDEPMTLVIRPTMREEFQVTTSTHSTVDELANLVGEKLRTGAARIQMCTTEKVLDSADNLRDNGLSNGSVVHLVMQTRSGDCGSEDPRMNNFLEALKSLRPTDIQAFLTGRRSLRFSVGVEVSNESQRTQSMVS